MAIYDNLMGAPGAGGRVVLLCKKCMVPAADAKTASTVLKVCSKCGTPLGEWDSETQRDSELKEFAGKVTTPVMKRYRIKITSGVYAGRYVGLRFGGGLVTNPEVQKTPPVNIEGAKYGLWAQEGGATQFFEQGLAEPEAALRAAGIAFEKIEVE